MQPIATFNLFPWKAIKTDNQTHHLHYSSSLPSRSNPVRQTPFLKQPARHDGERHHPPPPPQKKNLHLFHLRRNEILKLEYYFNNDELKRQVSARNPESCD